NRLASNSLLEGLVFGLRAAEAASMYSKTSSPPSTMTPSIARQSSAQHMSEQDVEKLRNSLRRLMWTKVGLIRTGESLRKALDQLQQWSRKLQLPPFNRTGLETQNMVQVGRSVTEAALWRTNSVGAHYREDIPFFKGLKWKVHSQCQQTPETAPASHPQKAKTPRRT
ncbi:MAG: L-aspartate oxidase, partial [Nitrospirota bacterium]|nr:L-aspartate oxidase [Nitrospirota bacterium]